MADEEKIENVPVTVNFSPEIEKQLMEAAAKDGHNNRSAIIRKAINQYLKQAKEQELENAEKVSK